MFNLLRWKRANKLPEERRVCVVADKNKDHIGLAYVDNGEWKDFFYGMPWNIKTDDYELTVTHYIKLPRLK